MLLDIIFKIWQTMLTLFWFGKKSITNGLSVYVKSNTGDTVAVDLDPKWDIKNVKEVVAPKLGLPPEDLRIILAGKELDDSTVIEECDLGEQSILHAVRTRRTGRTLSGSKPLNETLADFTLIEVSETEDSSPDSEIGQSSTKAHFFVYCSSPCNGVRTGKLRVRCSHCKSGAITVDSDPASWQDVLTPKRISGHCEQQGCEDGPVAWCEFYFKCAEHKSEGEKDQAVPLHLIRANIRNIPCLACTEVSDSVLVFPCEEGHVTCLFCFTQYCTSRLRDRQFISHPEYGYTLPCPAGCSNSLIDEPHHFKVLPEIHYATYQRFGAEEYVLKSGGVLCPQPGCGAGILPDPDCDRITCLQGCGYVFCRKCRQGFHIGECETSLESGPEAASSYTIDPSKASQARWEEASRVKIKVTTKPCPKCRTATERDGGCMHMVCTRCSLEWCWVCQTEWKRTCMGDHWFG